MRGVANRKLGLGIGVALLFLVTLVVPAPAAPVTATVRYSSIPVADGDLDGNPSTGAWSGADSWTIPLENGATSPYGAATLWAKHDGTYVYFRVDGKIDVPWTSSSGNHFWFGIIFNAATTGHHSSWQDGVFFGEDQLTTAPPLVAVDTYGGNKMPNRDGQQDDLGRMAATGASAPYSFTAEWKRKLNTADGNDVRFTADGTTSVYFYANSDSNGGGSGGGSVDHRGPTTNDNVLRFEPVPSGDTTPPTVQITTPADAAIVSGTVLVTADAADDRGVAAVAFFVDGGSASTDTAPPYEFSWDTTAVANGGHTLLANATDAAGNYATDQISVTVNNLDTTPPVARAGPDQAVPPGTPVTFDGRSSTDNVGITDYVWTFTDGTPQTLNGPTAVYTFNNAGNFRVTLTVQDAALNTGTDELWVNVTADNAPPVARAGPDQAVLQGALVALNGSASTDDVAIANYTWTFADGGTVTLYGVAVQYRFLATGHFAVTLTVRDFTSKTGTDTVWVNVTADTIPPVAVAGPDQAIHLGDPVTLNGSGSSDNIFLVNYTWTAQGNSTEWYGPLVVLVPSAGGVLVVVLTVTDASGLSASDTVNVTVIAPDRVAPAAVTGIVATSGAPGEVLLEWNPNTEADLLGYFVFRVGPDGVPIQLNGVPIPDASFVDSGLVPGQSYDYVVKAVDEWGNLSGPSSAVTGSAGAPPPAPFDWLALRWAIAPGLTVLAFAILALLARKETARRRPAPPPSVPPPPPPKVGP